MKNPLLFIVIAVLAASCTPTQAQRHAWVTGLKPEKADTYRKLNAAPRPEVSATIKRCNIRNFSIHEREIAGKTYLFAYPSADAGEGLHRCG